MTTKIPEPVVNILTFDVEDYYMVSGFSTHVQFEDWASYKSRVAENVTLLLDILEELRLKATFFVLGWVGEKHPALVREIARKGHEIACHGYRHELVYNMTPEAFREDTRKAKTILEDISGEPVAGFRAPSFSVTRENIWALEILAGEGFTYDSSIFPIRHDRYGYPEFSRIPKIVATACGDILEIPPSTLRMLGRNIPFAGGGYFRLFPLWFTEWGIRTVNGREGHPAVVYLHPWELDPGQPRIPGSRMAKFRHYLNLNKTEQRLRTMLRRHRFGAVREVYGNVAS